MHFGFGAHVPRPPPQAPQGIFPWSSVWAFLGFLRRFVGLAHVVFYRVFWPLSSCFRFNRSFFAIFLRFLVGAFLLIGVADQSQLSHGLPPISVHSSEASGSSFPGSTNQRPVRVGAAPLFGADVFSSAMVFLWIFRLHTSYSRSYPHSLSEPFLAMVEILRGLLGTIASREGGFAAPSCSLVNAE